MTVISLIITIVVVIVHHYHPLSPLSSPSPLLSTLITPDHPCSACYFGSESYSCDGDVTNVNKLVESLQDTNANKGSNGV
ncbi:unnamed protein product [Onchocerca flexuosa]|uniref:Secreted protein n=1 Tax=Onchocerca flexuosa TaxID=387005 RepID=A0A183I004_9BILA|nr:unnamed protein product [Onchocerca flexuosa]